MASQRLTRLKILNFGLSVLIVAAFLYLLVLAMAQEQVLAGLKRLEGFQNYSSSLTEARNAEADRAQQAIVRAARIKAQDQRDALNSQINLKWLGYQRRFVSLQPIMLNFERRQHCDLVDESIRKPRLEDSPETAEFYLQETKLSSFRTCLRLNPTITDEATRGRLIKEIDEALTNADNMDGLNGELVDLDAKILRLEAEEKRLAQAAGEHRAVQAEFQLLNAFRFPGPLDLVTWPPFVVLVLLSFFSGTFGALLITTVFVVYRPKKRERISPQLYLKRVALGGLVSVAVFIVVAGGASILTGSAGTDGGTNLMSFCAIGVLSGMFSDLVADWLSDRARTMFRFDDDEDKAGEGESDQARPATD